MPGTPRTATAFPVAPLGAVLAGGASRRFGSPKALAEVGGRTVLERVLDALRAALPDVVLIAHHPEWPVPPGVPVHPDDRPGLGPLGGIRTALRLAAEAGRPGALCLACDLPFASAALLRLLLARAAAEPERIVAPEREPLCAYYPVACLPALDALLEAGERRAAALAERFPALRVPPADLSAAGDPDVLFLNLNTPDDLRRAREIASHVPA
ncbi:MAG TPA: molybdenum cofactor guanylyltransferase [Longimicrobiaceae bacterium]|nr:molybdenum cofactor guanylyltransferase [Longimicrobiaceae bacterium]